MREISQDIAISVERRFADVENEDVRLTLPEEEIVQTGTAVTSVTVNASGNLSSTGSPITGAGAVTISMTPTPSFTTVSIAGTQVLSSRKTGWGSPSGTLSRGAYSGTTAASLPVGAAYTQSEIEAIRNEVVALSQRLAALLADLHGSTSGHGLIGS